MMDSPTRFLKVFLCHASQDKPVVRELYNALKSENWIDPWLDKAKILPGQDWEMVIEKAVDNSVDNSDVVIACLSNSSVTKEGFVQREIRYAYDIALEKPEDTIFLIPLRLDNCNVPRKLRALHWVDYFGIEKEDAYSDLLGALKLRYEQKIRMESDELARRRAKEKSQYRSDELARKDVVQKASDEKEKIESIEKTALEKSEIMRMQKTQRRMERYIKEGAKEYDRKEKIEKFVEEIFDWVSVNIRLLGISSVILFVLILGGFGLNYLFKFKNLPVATATISFLLNTETPGPATSTNVPSTLTPTSQQIGTLPPKPVLGIGSTITGKDGMILFYVPAGEFTMGSDTSDADGKPSHTVFLDAFFIDQTEVTNKMFSDCEKAGFCTEPTKKDTGAPSIYYGNIEYDSYPVIYVDWGMANNYCKWVGRRLPTEAEWEKSARGTDALIYPWGNKFDGTRLNYCDKNCSYSWADKSYNDGYPSISPVGSYLTGKSIYGALDMAGNVWEWVADWYDSSYYVNSPEKYPKGPSESGLAKEKVVRGGSWFNDDQSARSHDRKGIDSSVTDLSVGFRCAVDANQ